MTVLRQVHCVLAYGMGKSVNCRGSLNQTSVRGANHDIAALSPYVVYVKSLANPFIFFFTELRGTAFRSFFLSSERLRRQPNGLRDKPLRFAKFVFILSGRLARRLRVRRRDLADNCRFVERRRYRFGQIDRRH